MAILSLVGKHMRNMVGIAGRMFSSLAEGNVNLEMISQGASEINISCVIDGRDAAKALNLIHQSCLQISPEGTKGRGAFSIDFIAVWCLTSLWLQLVHGYFDTHIEHSI